jgi:hypothetical protein
LFGLARDALALDEEPREMRAEYFIGAKTEHPSCAGAPSRHKTLMI